MKTYKEFRKSIGFPVKERKVEEVIRSEKPLKEDVVDQLRSVVKKKKEADIKFKSGTSVPIDPESANTILKTFERRCCRSIKICCKKEKRIGY